MNSQHKSLSPSTLDALFTQQQYKYIKLFSSANPQIAQEIKDLKREFSDEKYSLDGSTNNKYSIVH
jgi:hypothetical protein